MAGEYDKPTVDVGPEEAVHQAYNAKCVDVDVPRSEETESHCTVHARGNANLDPSFGTFHEGYRFNKRTHKMDLRKAQGDPPLHTLRIVPKPGAEGS